MTLGLVGAGLGLFILKEQGQNDQLYEKNCLTQHPKQMLYYPWKLGN